MGNEDILSGGGIDIDEMRKISDSHEGGGWQTFQVGDTTLYICPRRPGYKVNFIETAIHRVGPNGTSVMCFNPKKNPILKNEKFLALVKVAGLKLGKVCSVCSKIDAEDLWTADREKAMKLSAKSRFIWLVVQWATRSSAKDEWHESSPKRVKPWNCPKQQWDQIRDFIFDSGDITNPDKAKLVKFTREGQQMNTRYTASPDTRTLESPLVLGKDVRATIIKALTDPELEYEKLAVSLVVSQEEIDALLSGVAIDADVDPEAGEGKEGEPDVKPCHGVPTLYNPADNECKTCAHAKTCAEKVEAASAGALDKLVEKPAEPPKEEVAPPHTDDEAPAESVESKDEAPELSFDELPFTGTLCSVCMQPQKATPNGDTTCVNGHGGADPFDPTKTQIQKKPETKPAPEKVETKAEAKVETKTETPPQVTGTMSRLDKLLKGKTTQTQQPRTKA